MLFPFQPCGLARKMMRHVLLDFMGWGLDETFQNDIFFPVRFAFLSIQCKSWRGMDGGKVIWSCVEGCP